jgi:hypothetical protein
VNDNFDDQLYQSGLTAQGCWDELDSYAREAIARFGQLVVNECCSIITEWKKEPFPFDEDVAVDLLRKRFGIK